MVFEGGEFEGLLRSESFLLSRCSLDEGYGLQPVHWGSQLTWALAPEETIPQRLKPHVLKGLYVRAKARTLHQGCTLNLDASSKHAP
jgi:hypothetical protein